MVCRQTKTGQPYRHFLVSLPHQVHKCGEVVILMKDVTAAIAPVQDVETKPPRDALDVLSMDKDNRRHNPYKVECPLLQFQRAPEVSVDV